MGVGFFSVRCFPDEVVASVGGGVDDVYSCFFGFVGSVGVFSFGGFFDDVDCVVVCVAVVDDECEALCFVAGEGVVEDF